MNNWNLLIAAGQLLLALLMWLGWDRKMISRKFFSSERRSGVMLLLILGGWTFAGYGWIATRQASSVPVRTASFKAWGSEAPFCRALVDASSLIGFRDKYGIAIVCGLADSTVDKFEDQRITISPLFTIQSAPISIAVRYGKEMEREITERRDEAQRNAPKGVRAAVVISTWYEIIVLPPGFEVSRIRRLSDVPRHGGKILSLDFRAPQY